jgi:hypothetical protein
VACLGVVRFSIHSLNPSMTWGAQGQDWVYVAAESQSLPSRSSGEGDSIEDDYAPRGGHRGDATDFTL